MSQCETKKQTETNTGIYSETWPNYVFKYGLDANQRFLLKLSELPSQFEKIFKKIINIETELSDVRQMNTSMYVQLNYVE